MRRFPFLTRSCYLPNKLLWKERVNQQCLLPRISGPERCRLQFWTTRFTGSSLSKSLELKALSITLGSLEQNDCLFGFSPELIHQLADIAQTSVSFWVFDGTLTFSGSFFEHNSMKYGWLAVVKSIVSLNIVRSIPEAITHNHLAPLPFLWANQLLHHRKWIVNGTPV